jgi:hypothetical protein
VINFWFVFPLIDDIFSNLILKFSWANVGISYSKNKAKEKMLAFLDRIDDQTFSNLILGS